MTHRAGALPFVFGAMRLSRIFNDKKTMRSRELENWIHVGRLTVKMNGNNCLGPFGERLLQPGRVHRVSTFVNVDEHRPSCTVGNCFSGSHEGVWNRDDFVTRSN